MSIKKTVLSLFLLVLLATSYSLPATLAATPTPAAPSRNEVPQEAADLEKIQRIKDLVASKVAELNLVEKRGIIGTIREVTNMKVVVTDLKGNSRQIDVDELTKFNVSKTTSGISDLKKGTTYSFVGLYNKETRILLARSINSASSIPAHFEGAIVSLDKSQYQLEVVNEKGEKRKVDIQNSTKTSLAAAEGDLLKSGFSKLSVNERLLAIGFWDKKDSNLIAAIRVIHFEDVPPSKQMQSHIPVDAIEKEK